MCRSKTSRIALIALGCTAMALALTEIAFAQAVDNAAGPFQLEGNATVDTSICFPLVSPCTTPNVTFGGTTDDWANLAHALAKTVCNPSLGECVSGAPTWVIKDLINTTSDNIFTGGGSKDTLGISSAPWLWKNGKPQAKDDIEHVFVGAYTLSNGDTAVYFGMTRYDNSGDATAGFWFFQDSTVGIASTSCGVGSGCPFSGHHTNNDLLIVSDFSTGGVVSTIAAYKWVCSGTGAACDSSGVLTLISSGTENCNPISDSNTKCAIVNPIPVTSPWTFANKGSTGQTCGTLPCYDHGELLEGSVNLNALFGGTPPCFTTFMGETRSSTSPTSTLSDFSPPSSFPLCKINADKQCTGSQIVGGNQLQYFFQGNVYNQGVGTLYSPTVSDTPPTGGTGLSLTQPTATSIAPGGSASYSGSFFTSALLGSNDKNLVSASASSSSTGSPQNVTCGANPPTSASDACADWGDPTQGPCPPAITPGLTLAKACSTCVVGNSDLHVSVNETFKVCNTGNVNISGISIQDCRNGTVSGAPGNQQCSSGSFAPIASGLSLNAPVAPATKTCQTVTANYTPTSISLCFSQNCTFSDQAIASGTAALNGTVYANNGTAASNSCSLCPISTDCTPPTIP